MFTAVMLDGVMLNLLAPKIALPRNGNENKLPLSTKCPSQQRLQQVRKLPQSVANYKPGKTATTNKRKAGGRLKPSDVKKVVWVDVINRSWKTAQLSLQLPPIFKL